MGKRVVIVEDMFLISEYLSVLCRRFGMEIVGKARDGESAMEIILDTKPDFVLMDVRLAGDMDGVDVALAVRPHLPEAKVIFITGSNEPPTLAKINTDHPYRVFIKPVDPDALREAFAA